MISSRRLKEAERLLKTLCKKHPADTESLTMLGYVYSQKGAHSKAIQCLLKAAKLMPKEYMAYYNLANAYKAAGNLSTAVETYKKAISINQSHDACINLANTLTDLRCHTEARNYLQLAISIKPDDANTYYNLGINLKKSGLLEDSIKAYQKAIDLNPEFAQVWNNLGNAFLSTGDLDKADDCYKKALSLYPDFLDALSGQIRLLDKKRDFDTALKLIRPHLEQKTAHAGLCATFADFCHYTNQEEDAIDWINTLLDDKTLSPADKSRLGFLAGKIFDRKKDYSRAFNYYKNANALQKQSLDFRKISAYFSSIKKSFNRKKFNTLASSHQDSRKPVFIVGMPRSGTSLVEQILASHPDVAGAGELETISSLTEEAADLLDNTLEYPKVIEKLNSMKMDILAQKYMQRIEKVDPNVLYITDKMPHNFLHLGFIQLLFPQCRIIHCQRNPLDTLLSCYFQDFAGNHPYSHDLSDLAEYYCLYADLMTHWQKNLQLPVLTIDYEKMINNQEAESRKLIEFCQLDWHEDCLNFHQNKRVVSTASYDQVRQKLYTTSVRRWQNYESHIQQLIKKLSDYL